MFNLILRSDLEPWSCDICSVNAFKGTVDQGKFYCVSCAGDRAWVQNYELNEEESEVIFKESL